MNIVTAIVVAFLGSPAHSGLMSLGSLPVGPAPGLSSSVMLGSAVGGLDQRNAAPPAGAPRKSVEQQRIVIVVSMKNPIKTLTRAELGRIFLRKQNQWSNGWAITVFVRPMKAPIRQRFSLNVLHKKPESLREYWLNLKLTRGLKPPKVLRSAMLVKRYLERVKGGIAYLYEDEVDETVRVVGITKK